MITVTFTRDEIAALLALMDAGVKALGRPAARACAVLDEKIGLAMAEASAQAAQPARVVEALPKKSNGSSGDNDMPGRLMFSTTADGASATTERVRIDARPEAKINADDDVAQRRAPKGHRQIDTRNLKP